MSSGEATSSIHFHTQIFQVLNSHRIELTKVICSRDVYQLSRRTLHEKVIFCIPGNSKTKCPGSKQTHFSLLYPQCPERKKPIKCSHKTLQCKLIRIRILLLSPAAGSHKWCLFYINLTACPAEGAHRMRMVTPSEIEKSGQNPSGPLILETTCTSC